jgi:soluble cytochrome b562
MTNAPTIDNTCILVGLTIGMPRKTFTVKDAAQVVADDKQSSADWTKVTNSIFDPKAPALKDITTLIGKARHSHNGLTGFWSKEWQIMGNPAFGSYREVMDDYETEFWDMVEVAKAAYPDMVADAHRNFSGLGDMFNPDLYPDVDVWAASFKFELTTELVNNHQHIALPGLSKAQVARVEAEMRKADIAKREAVKTETKVWVASEIGDFKHAMKRFGEEIEGSKKPATFRDTMVSRMVALANYVDATNLDGDAEMTALAMKIRTTLASVEPAKIRGNDPKDKRSAAIKEAEGVKIREKMIDDATEIENDLQDIFGG